MPRHHDAVAIRFPEVKIIMAHLGHPYEGECVVTARKHPNVYADISALHYRPFQLYQSLMLVQEYGVWDKILFGTDYPFTTVNASIAGLRKLNDMTAGTGLPRLNEQAIEAMIQRVERNIHLLVGQREIELVLPLGQAVSVRRRDRAADLLGQLHMPCKRIDLSLV